MASDERPQAPPEAPGSDDAQGNPFGALRSGTQVGKYEIVEMLGQGAFGITYRARDTQLRRDVAVKEYLPTSFAMRQGSSLVLPRATETADDFRWGRERFLEEARTLATLEGAPGIVNVHDFMEANGTAYMVMELVRGETVAARLKRDRRLHQPAIELLLYPLLDGLERVHDAGFLHRDIKPANILLDPTGRPTLIDFGAARVALVGRTQALTTIYTPGYAAFEQSTSVQQGPWTDIYALAATLYHCVSGAPPPAATDRMIDDQLVSALEAGKGRYAPTLLAAIDSGLKLKAPDRPQTIDEWRRLLAGMPAATLGPVTRDVAEPPTRRTEEPSPRPAAATTGRKPIQSGWIAAGVMALVIVAGGGWMILRPAPETPEQTVLRLEEEGRRLIAQATKLRQDDEARQRAAAEARRRADEEVARRAAEEKEATEAAARQQTQEAERQRAAAVDARRKAEEEAARRATEKKAAEEAVARRKAEEEAAERAGAEATKRRAEEQARAEAEAKRKAEEEAARKATEEKVARDKAEAEAKRKTEAEARAATEAKAKADVEAKRQAEAAEAALRLSEEDRKLVQVALTSLGHNTQGSDGAFGPRTRQMIAAWQKNQSTPETGYLTAAQLAALRQQAAPALARYDEEQKKIEDDKRKAEEEAKKRAEEERRPQPPSAAPPSVAAAPSTTTPAAGTDGRWSGRLSCGLAVETNLSVQVAAGVGQTPIFDRDGGPGEISLRITGDSVIAEVMVRRSATPASLRGSVSGQRLTAGGNLRALGGQYCWLTLDRGAPSAAAPGVATAPSATTPAAANDGQWSGTLYCERGTPFTQHGTPPQEKVSFQLVGGVGRASFMTDAGAGDTSLRVTGGSVVADVAWATRVPGYSSVTLRGSVSGRRLTASGRLQAGGSRLCTLTLDRQ